MNIELPKFPPNEPTKALINPLFFGKYLVAFFIAAVIEIPNPTPKKIFMKKSKINFFEIVNRKSPKAKLIPPSNITYLGPK